MLTDTIIEDARWNDVDLAALSERAATEVLRFLDLERDYEIAVLGCDDTKITELNGSFRDKPTPTNVLSWPSEDLASEQIGGMPDTPQIPELGDIAIAFETCAREAETAGKPLEAHVLHLIVHATLHLLGFDHVEDADAEVMESLERRILAQMGEPDPYV